MAVTHGTAIRGNIAQAVLDGLGAAAKYVVLDAADTVLATFNLDNPAASRSGAILTVLGLPKTVAAAQSGTAAKFAFRDGSDADIWLGSLLTAGGDMTIDNATIVAGQTLSLNATTSYESAP